MPERCAPCERGHHYVCTLPRTDAAGEEDGACRCWCREGERDE